MSWQNIYLCCKSLSGVLLDVLFSICAICWLIFCGMCGGWGCARNILSLFLNLSGKICRKFLEDACVWVESNTTTLSILSSQAEIGLGLLLVVSLFSLVSELTDAYIITHCSFHFVHMTFHILQMQVAA